ncbi:hypothetical protein SLE2022_306270 [Rubroshorea leprosula]
MGESDHHQADSNAIEKVDGNFLLAPRAFDIPWGKDYWRIPPETKVGEPAAQSSSLKWIELSSSVTVVPGKKYRISFRLGIEPDAYGYEGTPVFLMAKIGRTGRHSWKRLKKLEKVPRGPIDTPDDNDPFEIEVPSSAVSDPTLHFGIYETCAWNSKKGLLLYSASVKEV